MENDIVTLATNAGGPTGVAGLMGWLYWKERKRSESLEADLKQSREQHAEVLEKQSELFKELWLRAEEDV